MSELVNPPASAIKKSNKQSVHFDTIKSKVPGWLVSAPSQTHRALRQAGTQPLSWFEQARLSMPDIARQLQQTYSEHRQQAQQVDRVMAFLPAPEVFAEPLLIAALKKRFGLDVDVRNTYLVHAKRATVDSSFASLSKDPVVQSHNALKAATQTLLHAALQNFEAGEAEGGGMDQDERHKAAIYDGYPVKGFAVSGTVSTIPPEQFAALCRELDLGGQYQALIKSLFTPNLLVEERPDGTSLVNRGLFNQFDCSAFVLQVHLAYLKNRIDKTQHSVLLEVARNSRTIEFGGQSYSCRFLQLWDVELTGIVVIGKALPYPVRLFSSLLEGEQIMVYIPDDPVHPLKAYDSLSEFIDSMRERMLQPGYLKFFERFVPARQRSALFTRINKAFYPKVWNSEMGWYEQGLDKTPTLDLEESEFSGTFLAGLYRQKVAVLKDDGLFHAVPTAAEDQKTFDERLSYFEEKLFQALNVAAFFVPGLGEVMLAVTAMQLSYEVYEGIESWAKGEQEQAWGYLMDVLENVALMAALGAAGRGAGETPAVERIPVETPSFIEELKPVELPSGETRLWKPDLAPFAHDIILPSGLKPDEFGLYHYQGKTWLPLEDKVYSVKPSPITTHYHLEHSTKAITYEPSVRHNGAGAWIHELDQPLEWEGLTLFRRLGHSSAEFSDITAQRILRVSETHEAVLRRVLAEGERPPALLEDTMQRFQLDQDLGRFIEQMQLGHADADPRLQLQLLAEDPSWPDGRALAILDAQGEVLEEYGIRQGNRILRPLNVQLGQGDELSTVLSLLDDREIAALLGDAYDAGSLTLPSRLRAVRQKLASSAQRRRTELFDLRYQAAQASQAPAVTLIQRVFNGLPNAIAEELVRHAKPAELEQLGNGQLPARISDEARVYQQQVRLARAYEGLYLDSVHHRDSEKLILHTLETLPGWSPEVLLEVRDGFLRGPLIDSVGPPNAAIRRVLIKDAKGYQACGADDKTLGEHADLYASVLHALPDDASVLHALPDAQRRALGFPSVDQGPGLKRAAQGQKLLPRNTLRQILQMAPIKPGSKPPMKLADGRPGYILSGEGKLGGFVSEDTLLDMIRELELDALPEAILRDLYAVGLGRLEVRARLIQLLDEQQALRNDLRAWATASILNLDEARMTSRSRIGDALWAHWQANGLPEIGRTRVPLRLHSVSLADFPEQLPAFVHDRVTVLELVSISVDAPTADGSYWADRGISATNEIADSRALGLFFRRFPRVTSLEMIRRQISAERLQPLLYDLPQVVAESFPALRELRLINQGIHLNQMQMDLFRGMENLQRLDLSGNPVGLIPPTDLSGLHLQYLGLDHTGLDRWPAWLDGIVPEQIVELSLVGNRITELPEYLLQPDLESPHHTVISLQGNVLSRGTIIRIRLSEEDAGQRFTFNLDIAPSLQLGLDALMHERRLLREAVDNWAQASGSSAPLSEESRLARQRAGALVLDFWRASSTGESFAALRLEALALSDFPRPLPDFFYPRVRNVQLLRVSASPEQFNQFLRGFAQLRSVTLRGHVQPLSQLPQALLELPSLDTLQLIDQGLVVNQHAMEFFARLPALSLLGLDQNVLGTISDVSALARRGLRMLSLNNVGLQRWPAWLDELIPGSLETLALEHNQLTDLPEHILYNPRNLTSHTDIALQGNPLSRDTMYRAHMSEAFNRTYSFSMDLPPDIRAIDYNEAHSSDSEASDSDNDSDSSGHAHSPGLAAAQEAASVEPWLQGSVEESEARRGIWQGIESANDAPGLLNLIARLRHTADYRTPRTRLELVERVWRVLEVVAQDTQLRLTLNGMSEEPLRLIADYETCPDGIRLEFNQMEVLIFTRQSLLEVPAQLRGQTLYRLTRRLYRLQELDTIAREQAGSRDEAEVRLAYRLHWARELDLPLPPGSMLYESHAHLQPGELDRALGRVQQGESGEPFMAYALQRDFWVDYLREVYAERFRELKEAFEAQVIEFVDLYPADNDDQLSTRVRTAEQQLKDDEQNLIRELTNREGLEHD